MTDPHHRRPGGFYGRALTDLIVIIAFLAIVASMLMTIADIVLRVASSGVEKVNGIRPSWGLFGLVDLTQLAMMCAIPLAIAVTFFLDRHIRIELLLDAIPTVWQRAAGVLSAIIGMSLTGIILWTAIGEIRGQMEYATTSATLNMPYIWYWLPLVAGFALSVLACIIRFVRLAFMRTSAATEADNA